MQLRTIGFLLFACAAAGALILIADSADAHPVGGVTHTCHFAPPLGQGCPSGNTLTAGDTLNFENPDVTAHHLRVTRLGGAPALNTCVAPGAVTSTINVPWNETYVIEWRLGCGFLLGDVPVQVGVAASLNPGALSPPGINWPQVTQCVAGGGIGGVVQHCVGYINWHPGNCFGYVGSLVGGGMIWAGICSGPGHLLFCMGQSQGAAWWEHCTGIGGGAQPVQVCEYSEGTYTTEGGVHQRTTLATQPTRCRMWNLNT